MFDECNSDNLKGSATLSSTCVPLNSFWSTCHFCPCAAVTTSSHNRPELGRCPPSPVAAAPLRTFLPAPAVRSWGSSPRQCLGWINKEKKKEREKKDTASEKQTSCMPDRDRETITPRFRMSTPYQNFDAQCPAWFSCCDCRLDPKLQSKLCLHGFDVHCQGISALVGCHWI